MSSFDLLITFRYNYVPFQTHQTQTKKNQCAFPNTSNTNKKKPKKTKSIVHHVVVVLSYGKIRYTPLNTNTLA